VEVVGELAAEFQTMEEQRSRLERPTVRIYDLLLGPPSSQARLADRLDEVAKQLRAKLAIRREEDAELEASWTSVVRVQDLVLGSVDGPSSLAASMSTVAELLEVWIDAAAANGVCWGSCSTLVAAVSHFSELETELEVLRSRRNVDLTEGEADAVWTWVRMVSDSLALYVPSSVAYNILDGAGE
jgi:hypothetical protein